MRMHKRPRAKTCFSSTYTVSTTATAVSMAVVLLSCACAFQLQPGAVRDIHVLHNQDYRRLVPSGRGGFADFRRSRDSNWALREAEMAASVQKVSETESLEGSIPQSSTWHWRNGWEVHYERARRDGAPPLLLLPGFGVGTFHFKRNMQELSKTHDVYALDFLGQGKSWPTRAPSREDGLCYSVDTWTDQVLAFLQEVVGEPTYVVGNSLGGYIGTYLAANHPEWVSGLALLNATPFWAFRNPRDLETIPRTPVKTPLSDTSAKEASSLSGGANENPGVVEADACLGNAPESIPTIDRDEDVGGGLSSTQDRSEKRSHGRSGPSDGGGGGLLGWDGILPAPAGFFRFGAWYFDRMRDPRTVRSMLGAVYSSPEAVDDDLIDEIIAATDRGPSNHDYGVGGHEAFTSIVFAPKVGMTFEEMIDRLQMPVVLIYGKEDPWVVPLWGHRIKRQRPHTLYYQVSPSGHSPHHETPRTVNAILVKWLEYARNGGAAPLSGPDDAVEMLEATGVTARVALVPDAQPRGAVEWIDSIVWEMTNS